MLYYLVHSSAHTDVCPWAILELNFRMIYVFGTFRIIEEFLQVFQYHQNISHFYKMLFKKGIELI